MFNANMLLSLVSLLIRRGQQGIATKIHLHTTVMLLDFHHLFPGEEIKKSIEVLSIWTRVS